MCAAVTERWGAVGAAAQPLSRLRSRGGDRQVVTPTVLTVGALKGRGVLLSLLLEVGVRETPPCLRSEVDQVERERGEQGEGRASAEALEGGPLHTQAVRHIEKAREAGAESRGHVIDGSGGFGKRQSSRGQKAHGRCVFMP